MHRVETLVVGAGQAGLAVSRCLTERGADHVVLERGRVAERWRTARWDSLRLITPNWMSRLPGWSYSGTDPDGYMAAPELASYLQEYASSFAAPVHEGTTVERVEACADGLRVVTGQRTWLACNVVVAAGTENLANVPPVAGGIDPRVHQLTASRYQGPHQIPDGGVLVVGASASGAQIADELRRSGRPVTISVGQARPDTPPLPGPRHLVVDAPGRGPGPHNRSDARRTVGPHGAVAAAIWPQRPQGQPGGTGRRRRDAGRSARRSGRPPAEFRR